MTNPTGTQWENALLSKLTSNGERIAVVEKEIKDVKQIVSNLDGRLSQIEKLLGWLKIIGAGVVTIALSLIANFIYSILAS